MRVTFWSAALALLILPVRTGNAQEQEPAPSETAPAEEDAPSEAPPSDDAPPDDAASEDAPTDAPAPEPPAETSEGTAADPAPTEALPNEDTESFNLQLRKLQDKVDRLKQRVYDSKARLTRLKEVVMHGAISGAKAVMTHKNEMGSSFRLTRIQYALDGATIFNRADTGDGELDDVAELVIFDGSIAPGEHQISVYLEYAGDGFGVFDYLENYTFKIKSSYTFTAEEGKLTSIDIVGYEKGNFTTELKDRVAVRYAQTSSRATRGEEETAETDNE
ncbi:MAG: dihydrolipoamide acetyltransferase [Myxococcota bacterium]